MHKIFNITLPERRYVLLLLFALAVNLASAQQGSYGNTSVFGGTQMTLFGAHTFATGASGTQPGIIKTTRTAPQGIVSFSTTAATYTGASDANHVDGYVSKSGTTAFIFPVGNGTKLRTIGVSAPASGTTIKAAYWSANPNTATLPAGAPFLVANLGTGVTGVSTTEYWDLDGTAAVNVTLTWDAASALNTLTSSNIANLVVVGYNPTTSKWENLGNAGGTTGTLAGTGSITANGVTPDNYSAFTFGTSAAAPTTPDLRPFLIMANVSFTASATTRAFNVRVRNMRDNTSATDPVSVRVYKPTPTSTIVLTGASATEWTITSAGTYYTLTTNSDIPASPLGNTITASLTIPAAAASGAYVLRAFIPDLSGGELATDNGNNNITIGVNKN